MMNLAKLKTPQIACVKTLKKKCTLPRAAVRKTTSQAFRPRAEERKGSAPTLRKKAAPRAAAKKKTRQVKVTLVSRFKVPRMCLFARGGFGKKEQAGKPVAEKLANITKNRFSVKLSEKKLKEKMDGHQIPENCLEIKTPLLNEE